MGRASKYFMGTRLPASVGSRLSGTNACSKSMSTIRSSILICTMPRGKGKKRVQRALSKVQSCTSDKLCTFEASSSNLLVNKRRVYRLYHWNLRPLPFYSKLKRGLEIEGALLSLANEMRRVRKGVDKAMQRHLRFHRLPLLRAGRAQSQRRMSWAADKLSTHAGSTILAWKVGWTATKADLW